MESAQRVLSIGQCGVDNGSMTRVFAALATPLDGAHSLQRAEELLAQGGYALILVNRVLDADGSSGLSALEQLVNRFPHIPVMLVSNYADAQEAAVRVGALRGFGKAALHRPETMALLRETLAQAGS